MSCSLVGRRYLATGGLDPSVKYAGKSLEAAIRHCVALVSENDADFQRWASIAVRTKEDRAPMLVLKALQLEIDSIQLAARTEVLLRMRFQWWRDSIDKAFAARRSYEMAQPVMKAFSELVQSYFINQGGVNTMLDAYERDAMRGEACFQTTDELAEFARDSTGALVALQMEACGVDDSVVAEVAPSLGTGIGMATALRRAVGSLSGYGISYFPEDVCRRHGIDPGSFFDGQDRREALKHVARDIAEVARGHLVAGAAAAGKTGETKAFVTRGLSSQLWLNGLEKRGYDLLTKAGGVSPVEYLLKLKWNSL